MKNDVKLEPAMLTPLDVKKSLSEREKEVLAFWKENKIFERSVENRANGKSYSYYDGPPFATGLPHYGHLLAGTIKDVVQRFWTMKGCHVPRRFGWDCHGLPIENEIEKNLGLSGAASIEAYGIPKFNEECRKVVLRYTDDWKSIVERFGRWVDFSRTWKTMDLSYMESVWWVFGQLWEKGLVYEGYKVMPFSARLGTPLSNFEASENYKEVDDPSLTFKAQLVDRANTFLLVWTTTPWTLLSNLAITVGPEIEYVEVHHLQSGENYILAQARLSALFKEDEVQVLRSFKGKDLVGQKYEPIFPYFSRLVDQGAFHVISDDFVTLEDGTGLVHTAPGFGEADFYACQKLGIPVVCPVNQNGHFTHEVGEFTGRYIKDCDKDIIKQLKGRGLVLKHETLRHRYPFCWRSDTPLIYKAVATWFVGVEKIKEKLLASNEQIHWVPDHIKHGRFGKWLENARDWAISRNRYWGTPIPIWRAEDGSLLVIKSIQELEELSGRQITDLHRHFIDDIEIKKDGKIYKRIPEVFDCWFESGSMPYGQNHYPFEQKEEFAKTFPADCISEGLDQTRGWFYTLTVLSTALFEKPAFKNVIVNGIILAEDGHKMSKRLKNYPDPLDVVEACGADAVRLYMLASPAVRADDLCFSKAGVEGTLRQVLLPLWNSASFFTTYAKIYKWTPAKLAQKFPSEIDRWILSRLSSLVERVEEGMLSYELSLAVQPFVQFVDDLTNWYIRRCRRRFWNDEECSDRNEAFSALYIVIKTLVQIAAPFIPFTAEMIWNELKSENDEESVHLCDFPDHTKLHKDHVLEEAMSAVQKAASLAHSVRKERRIKVRQPLLKAMVISSNKQVLEYLREHSSLLADEINVKDILLSDREEDAVQLIPKPNFRILGKKIGKLMKEAQEGISKLSYAQLKALQAGSSISMTLPGAAIELTPEDVQVERIVHEEIAAQNEGDLTVALDIHLTEALIEEGFVREVVNKINTLRREMGLKVTDRITVQLASTDQVYKAIEAQKSYIMQEVLATSLTLGDSRGVEADINGENARIELHRDEAYAQAL